MNEKSSSILEWSNTGRSVGEPGGVDRSVSACNCSVGARTCSVGGEVVAGGPVGEPGGRAWSVVVGRGRGMLDNFITTTGLSRNVYFMVI